MLIIRKELNTALNLRQQMASKVTMLGKITNDRYIGIVPYRWWVYAFVFDYGFDYFGETVNVLYYGRFYHFGNDLFKEIIENMVRYTKDNYQFTELESNLGKGDKNLEDCVFTYLYPLGPYIAIHKKDN